MYVIKQDTGFAPYYLSAWDEGGKTETFAVRLDFALSFPTMDAAIKVAGAIVRKWLTSGTATHSLKVVSLMSQMSRRLVN